MGENVIEWITGQDEVTVTFTQRKFINRVLQLQEKGVATKVIQNEDGSICAHLPLSALHLYVIDGAGREGNPSFLKR